MVWKMKRDRERGSVALYMYIYIYQQSEICTGTLKQLFLFENVTWLNLGALYYG